MELHRTGRDKLLWSTNIELSVEKGSKRNRMMNGNAMKDEGTMFLKGRKLILFKIGVEVDKAF